MIIPGLDNFQLEAGLKAIRGFVADWTIPLAAIGTLSMATLQTAKNLLPMREWFQRRFLQRWIAFAVADFPENQKDDADSPTPKGVPVETISPVSRGVNEEMYAMSPGVLKMSSRVDGAVGLGKGDEHAPTDAALAEADLIN